MKFLAHNIKNLITSNSPARLLLYYSRLKRKIKGDKYKNIEIVRRSPVNNVFHCCPQKTGSQWIKAILADVIIYKNSGFTTISYPEYLRENKIKLKDKKRFVFPTLFPDKKIITPFYVSSKDFKLVPKPNKYRAFFVIRDPRDLLISQYFSKKKSHIRGSRRLVRIRKILNKLDLEEGLLAVIEELNSNGYWERVRSWVNLKGENIKIIRFEDLINMHSVETFKDLFQFCQMDLPQNELNELMDKYSFFNITKGRTKGKEDISSNYRKGISGDWINYFTPKVKKEFIRIAGDLVVDFGYEKDNNW